MSETTTHPPALKPRDWTKFATGEGPQHRICGWCYRLGAPIPKGARMLCGSEDIGSGVSVHLRDERGVCALCELAVADNLPCPKCGRKLS